MDDDKDFYKHLFRNLDRDKNGVLEMEELELALSQCSNRTDKWKFYLDIVDENGSGSLDEEEFINLMIISQSDYNSLIQSEEIFHKYNTNKEDNKLDRSELRNCVDDLGLQITEEDFEEVIREFDLNKDGKLSRTEFHLLIKAFENAIAITGEMHELGEDFFDESLTFKEDR